MSCLGDNDVTIIDTDRSCKIGSQMDVMTLNASAKEIKTLKNINISSRFLITTAGNDELNIVIASFAKSQDAIKS
ncbi:MAG: NAD-binding protein [Clostridia bacterium]